MKRNVLFLTLLFGAIFCFSQASPPPTPPLDQAESASTKVYSYAYDDGSIHAVIVNKSPYRLDFNYTVSLPGYAGAVMTESQIGKNGGASELWWLPSGSYTLTVWPRNPPPGVDTSPVSIQIDNP